MSSLPRFRRLFVAAVLLAPGVTAQKSSPFAGMSQRATVQDVINFQGLPPGTIVDEVFGRFGTGPVLVSGTNPALGAANAAVIFDSGNPTGEDPDLGSPNEDFGGPGIGSGGSAGSPFANNKNLRNVLIVAEDLVDDDSDGLVDDPDDADLVGAGFLLDFSAVGPVAVSRMDLLDVESDRPEATVEFFDHMGATIDLVQLPLVGDNGLATIQFGNVPGVLSMAITLNGSGAIDNIVFKELETGSIGDTVFCDLDDDGVQDPGEPGIEGVTVHLTCAGPDGVLGTADDIVDSQETDADGKYLFDELLPDVCQVEVDPATAPEGKVPGSCPISFTIALALGEDFLDADFCFIKTGEIGDTVYCDVDNDGVQDPEDPGIPGVVVHLTCAGPDGVLGTADDLVDSQPTDADGHYLFTDLPAGLCDVEVDPFSAPPDKVPGKCPLEFEVDLGIGESFLDADFCFITPGEVGDTVYCDLDNDGVQDPGEPGIENALVTLTCAGDDGVLGTADDVVDTQLTDVNGNYLFTGVLPDLCSAAVDPSTVFEGKVPGVCPIEFVFDLAPAESFLDADFCFITPGEIGDFVFCDVDLDGVADPGEPGIAGVVVVLTCAGPDGVIGTADDYLDSQATDATGAYLFTEVPPGLCEVEVDVNTGPEDKVPGPCPTLVAVDLQQGQSFLDADFCFSFPPGEIGDTVFCDLDDDGFQDPGEPGIEGVVVDLVCAGVDHVIGTADDLVLSQTTDADGKYLFTEIPAGLCEVAVDPSTGPPDKELGVCPPVVTVDLGPGESFLDADFCFRPLPPGEIGDFVYCDLDGDGVPDPGEPGIEGVVVNLLCAGPDGVFGTADDVVDSTVTDAGGNYLFTDVPAGACEVEVDPSTGPEDKVPGACPLLVEVDLAPGETFLDADFCFEFEPAEIGDTVFCDDVNNDGVQDPGEPGIPGVRVDLVCAGHDGLFGTADDVVDSQLTDANGNYLFTGLPPGPCEVTVDLATGPSDKIPGVCPTAFQVDLAAGQSFLDADFCFVTPGEIGDFVYCDLDDDGVQDPGEPGIEGVTVNLTCAGDDGVLGTADDLVDSQATDAAGFYLFTGIPPGPCEVGVDASTAPEDKELGKCPPVVTLVLAPAQSFLDADFCFVDVPEEICLVIIDEDTIDNDMLFVEQLAAFHGVEPDFLVNDDIPTEVGNPPLRWNELFPGDIALLPGGEVDDEGVFALPEDTPWTIEEFAAGTIPQSQLDKIPDVMPLRDQDLARLVGRTCVAVVYDSDISMNYVPINANLQGARYGLFTFTVLAVEVPHYLPEATSSSSLFSLWVRVEPPMMPTVKYLVDIHDHEPDSIQVTKAKQSGGLLTVYGESNFGSSSFMTLSVDGPDGGSVLAVDPFLLEQPMSFNPSKGRFEFTLHTGEALVGRRLKIATDHGGADNVYIE